VSQRQGCALRGRRTAVHVLPLVHLARPHALRSWLVDVRMRVRMHTMRLPKGVAPRSFEELVLFVPCTTSSSQVQSSRLGTTCLVGTYDVS